MKTKNKTVVDYYGNTDNYIHLKFGDCRKMYYFTQDFIEKYPEFAEEYKKYFNGQDTQFKNAFMVASHVFNNKIPVHFYYNFTDAPARGRKDIMDYLLRENDTKTLY